jgi:hypothetical protein
VATNDQTLTDFLTDLNSHNVTKLMKLFCQDDPDSTNPKFPCLGITDHGPAFLDMMISRLSSVSFL